MISITSATRSVIFQELKTSILDDVQARVSRVKTLDGGVVVTHSGVTDGDRTLQIKARLTETQAIALKAIYTNDTFISIAFTDGVFYGVIQTLKSIKHELNMTILIKERDV